MARRAKRILWSVILLLAVVLAAVCTYHGVKGYRLYQSALAECPIDQKVASIRHEASYTTLSELPEIYAPAVVAAEDHRFYQHGGVDPWGLLRAVWNNIRTFSLREGGSSITQQLAKNIYFSNTRSAERKIAEAFMAWELERNLEKDEILELYINSIYYGGGQYCVYDAAKFYFDKEPMELTRGECALLVGLPNAPSAYAPHVNPDLAEQRRRQVIDKMVRYKVVSQEEGEVIRNEKVV